MQNWKRTVGMASLCLTVLGATPVSAAEQRWSTLEMPPAEDAAAVPISAPSRMTVTGKMAYVDLEGGFYSVNGYRLIGDDAAFQPHLGSFVTVVGCLSDVLSIQMAQAIEVDQLLLAAESALETITGEVRHVDLEGGFYSVDGYRLIGDDGLFQSFLGQAVLVTGTVSDDPSIQMTKAFAVKDIALLVLYEDPSVPRQQVQANRAKPSSVTVDGTAVRFDRDLFVRDGILLIPLSPVVRAAGGSIDWDPAAGTATVEMPDRMAIFALGDSRAEMNENGVRYLQRNLITMAKAPEGVDGRVYVSADALSAVLGLTETGETSEAMQLVSPASSQGKKPADSFGTLYGAVKDLGTAESPAMLIDCGPMSNGEANLVWVSINDDTRFAAHGDAGDQAAAYADLAVGQRVTVDLAGPTMMSYPGRAAAASIVIETPAAAETLTGVIKQIESGDHTRILVESGAMSNGEPLLVWLAVSDDSTRVTWSDADDRSAGQISDLAVGQEVSAQLAGPLLTSYPAQGGASVVTILVE